MTSIGRPFRVVACDCERCRNGTRVAVDEYLGLRYPCVFPSRGDAPSHFALRVVVIDNRAEVEAMASELQAGVT